MTTINSINPGHVENGGMRDMSIPDYVQEKVSMPLHLPVVSVVTPIGKLASKHGTQWISPKEFKRYFGDIFDYNSPYYNPVSRLIMAVASGGQSTIGVRRVSANEEVARVPMAAFIYRDAISDYQRDANGKFKYDIQGNRVKNGSKTYQGLKIEIKPDPAAANVAVGALQVRTIAAAGDAPETVVYPLFEAIAGVGEEYNLSGLNFGTPSDTGTMRSVAAFVKASGVYPFQLSQFTDSLTGERTKATTPEGRVTAPFTLFPVEVSRVDYSLERGFGAFTGTNQNRPRLPLPAPFSSVHVYSENIDTVCQLLYQVEQEVNTSLVEVGAPGTYYKQMNPFTCTNHLGAPYYAVEMVGTLKWDMSASVKASGGVSPFLLKTGKVPEYVSDEIVNDPLGLLADIKRPLTHAQGWEINNELIAADLKGYVAGIEMKDVTRNRQSLWWDVGYGQKVKDIQAEFLAARKDIIVVGDGTIWSPGVMNDLEEVYARAQLASASFRLTPESEKWGTPASRAAVNIIEMKITDEKTGWYFSGNIDLAHKFARFAGSNSGLIVVANCPDHGENRKLTLGHSPNIVFEESTVAIENFAQGFITLKPWDSFTQTYRPGLPTVQTNPDSVLKDLVTPFLGVCIEKLSADQWREVCGDTTITSDNYASIMKDNIEESCRNAVGGMVSNITAETYYEEGTLGSRAKLRVKVHAWFNKAKYQMEFDLFMYNQQDLATAA